MKALVQREDSLIKPRQSQNRISGFRTDSVLKPMLAQRGQNTNMYISFPLRKYHFHMSKYQFQSKFVKVEKKIVKVEYKFVEVEVEIRRSGS